MWTGGKDSMLVLYVVREVAADTGAPVPPVVFINHFEHFDEIEAFVREQADRWRFNLVVARNEEFARLGASLSDEIPLTDPDDDTRRELARLGHEGEAVVLDADSFEGNHLLKTAALNDTLEARGFDGVFSGVRWGGQRSRGDEMFFSPRHDSEKYPPHDRVHPILQFEEADVWAAFWEYIVPDSVEGYPVGHVPASIDDLPDGVEPADLPVLPKYFEGYHSLGTESGSAKFDDRSVWAQDLGANAEREERVQDKEDPVGRLRDLSYMQSGGLSKRVRGVHTATPNPSNALSPP